MVSLVRRSFKKKQFNLRSIVLMLINTTHESQESTRTQTHLCNQHSSHKRLVPLKHMPVFSQWNAPTAAPVSPKTNDTPSQIPKALSNFRKNTYIQAIEIKQGIITMLSIILPIFCHSCFPFWTKGPFFQVNFLPRCCCEWMRAGGTNVDRNQSDLSLKSCSPREAPMTPPLFLVFILKCVFPICATPVLLSSQVATKHFFSPSLCL